MRPKAYDSCLTTATLRETAGKRSCALLKGVVTNTTLSYTKTMS